MRPVFLIWRSFARLHLLIRDHRIDTVFSFLVHANAMAALASLGSEKRSIHSSDSNHPAAPALALAVQAAAQYAASEL